ncbi:YqaJ viral recombinase family protein [Galbitalea sp. SE-J8]|uniref:YqaJ viral recombinase family nuclease n=1 Tax=Galbitalea sp. SE-J8 TaxID=3054952 RepID=UPI00259C70E3|nr:YqaJ viral recombinase family protein [Galbitalea sp. SE-J8]MDM4761917.1 YqaJ viral recombinase family protein [Galbitalea sp. SE-J8]
MSYRVLTATANTDEWLRLRQSGIGASEAAAVLGDTNWGSPLTVYMQKIATEIEDRGTMRMEWGHRLEAVIADAVAADHPELGVVLPSEGLLQCVEHPWLLGTLDRRLDHPAFGCVPLEIKSVSAHEKRHWVNPVTGDLEVPAKYTVQVRQQMFVQDDAPYGFVAVLFDGNELHVIRVPRSPAFIKEHLLGTLQRFWFQHVVKRIPPKPILGDDLARLWPAAPGKEIEADETFLDIAARWADAKTREKVARDDLAALKHYIGVFMEDAERVVDALGEPVMEMRTRRGSTRVAVAAHAEHHPDCTECVTRDADSRYPQAIIKKETAWPSI